MDEYSRLGSIEFLKIQRALIGIGYFATRVSVERIGTRLVTICAVPYIHGTHDKIIEEAERELNVV